MVVWLGCRRRCSRKGLVAGRIRRPRGVRPIGWGVPATCQAVRPLMDFGSARCERAVPTPRSAPPPDTESAYRQDRLGCTLAAQVDGPTLEGLWSSTSAFRQHCGELTDRCGSRLCENSLGVASDEMPSLQIASGAIFSTSPRVKRPPKLLGGRVFTRPRSTCAERADEFATSWLTPKLSGLVAAGHCRHRPALASSTLIRDRWLVVLTMSRRTSATRDQRLPCRSTDRTLLLLRCVTQ
jgi:hypothetical protein